MKHIQDNELSVNNRNLISFGLLLSIEPLDIQKLYLNDDGEREKLDWQADNTDHNNRTIFSRIMQIFKL
jgi:hypothetical protein